MTHLTDEFTLAHLELFTELEEQVAAVSPIFPEIEIDSVIDADFGSLYRVWRGMQLLGTFYRRLDGFWVSQAFHTSKSEAWVTDVEAVTAIAV
ncbi:hypothetical protein Cylst_5182 [Cylindrospermum stagnale PCC 7417]|uniref:Uncharacterized protein n=1 Tax=Cylindrospermum stagnale PCC 7417 TaxID=56107 RepID=K9X582_9NOST|nr:hypothetical protein [Cylindrospermum stagnale]AFZ27221.1 hypothetical protein Cylst_5182 [Cylindrospermum stagnale PCC 7417]